MSTEQEPASVAQNFKEAMRRVGSRNTVTDALWVLKNIDQKSRPLANNCLWRATEYGDLKRTVAYLKGKVRIASSRGETYTVTGKDYELIKSWEENIAKTDDKS
ncbi:MAG: hypothetical protein PHU86_03650 [Patescibacteria group bacterium]|jgi:hypothetical protein|nr:hypothetical protein [Patescibacteria group bacterium]